MNKRFARTAATVLATAMVAACGGGGGDGGDAAAEKSPVGFWNGTTSTGLTASVAVLPNGSTWAAYAGGSTLGFVNGNVNGAATDFNLTSGTITQGTISTDATTKQSITSRVSAGGQTVTFTGSYDASFEQTPSLAALAGTFAGVGPSAGTTVTVGANGAVTGTDAGCTFTGTATPRTDANAFNLTLTFGPAPCALPGLSGSGIAVYDSTARSLLAAAVNSARTAGAIFIGTKR
ncbi:hypothetical protein WG922_11095 [Ramlibacter sp. AN1015]|uniref:hypothetical protein n=1 Tax=Ramlibacter sp. AN1015 TaxID=3133428 RepID=UPI0030C1485D